MKVTIRNPPDKTMVIKTTAAHVRNIINENRNLKCYEVNGEIILIGGNESEADNKNHYKVFL